MLHNAHCKLKKQLCIFDLQNVTFVAFFVGKIMDKNQIIVGDYLHVVSCETSRPNTVGTKRQK